MKAPPTKGIVMIAAGIAAMALPMVAGFSLLAMLSIVLVVGAAAHAIYSLMTRRVRAFMRHALLALVYAGAAFYMFAEPVAALASLALLFAVLFLFEGVLLLGGWWMTRRLPRAGWMLANGLVSLALGLLMLATWPGRSGEILGLLLGVNLVFSGLTRLVYRPAITAARAP